MPTSENRQSSLSLRIGGGIEQFKLLRLDAFEGLSQHFTITIEVMSLGEVQLLSTIGTPAVIECKTNGEHQRWFHGLISEAAFVEQLHGLAGGYIYRFTLAPTAHVLDHGSDFRIFQQLSAAQIVEEVLSRRGIEHELSLFRTYDTLTYCVQYGESDFAFVSRLMEEFGLYYFYEHTALGHKMRVVDSYSAHDPVPGSETLFYRTDTATEVIDTIRSWQERATSGSEAQVSMRDYDFMTPGNKHEVTSENRGAHPGDQVEVYTWPGRYYKDSTGRQLSGDLLDSRRAERLRYDGICGNPSIQVGHQVTIESMPIARLNRKYLVIRSRTMLADEQYRSGGRAGETLVEFTAIPDDVQYRAPMVTPRPVVRGPETAVVTGPAGEEIYVDNYGRIKVQFHWDREGKNNESSSCWVRVSQTGGLGNIILPRIGHEVIVDFINGNPDRPLVVGRVFNADHMPVYTLPAHKTKALWRSKTYQRDNGDPIAEAMALDTKNPGANEIRFEDATGAEEVFFHAERDMNTRVRHNETHHTGRDVAIRVGKNRTEYVGANETIDIMGARKERVFETETVTVEKDRKVEVHKNDSLKVTKNIEVESKEEISITADKKITITVGGSSITLEPTKISIKTVTLEMEGSAAAKLSSAKVDIAGAGTVAAKSPLITLN